MLKLNEAHVNTGRTIQVLNLNDSQEFTEFFKNIQSQNVLLDLGCESKALFNELSNRKLLNGSRRLYLFGSLNESLDLLRLQNINIDSHVTVISEKALYVIKSVELRRGTTLHVSSGNSLGKKKIDLEGNTVFVAFTVSICLWLEL